MATNLRLLLLGVMGGLCLGSVFAASAVAQSQRQPTYPVFGILQTDPELPRHGNDIPVSAFESLEQRNLLYTSHTDSLRIALDSRKQTGCKTPVIVYMGGFTTNPGGATEIEAHYRSAVAMIDITTLQADIDASATKFRVNIPQDGELPIHASTADRTDSQDKTKFCFWIRIDDELMKVNQVDSKTGELVVQRGLDSSPAAHRAKAMVFSPIYLGNRKNLKAFRSSLSWPGARDYIRYGLDPAKLGTVQYKAGLIAELMRNGYDGAWLDTFQPVLFNLCDAVGRKVTYYWDFQTGRRYDLQSYVAALQGFIRNVRKQVKETVGRDPYLAANSVSGCYNQGGKLLFSAPDRPGLLDAYCFEDSYIAPRAQRSAKGKKLEAAAFIPTREERWLTHVTDQTDAAQSGLHALCMAGPAGYVAAYINPRLKNYDSLIRFSWCSFLLTVTKERTTTFGLPFFLTSSGNKIQGLPLPELFFAPLGDPVDHGTLESLRLPGTPCYLRHFEHGVVVVNPSNKDEPAIVKLSRPMVDFESKRTLTQLSLPSGDACLLLDSDASK